MNYAELIDAELNALEAYYAARNNGQTYKETKPLLDAYRSARQAADNARAMQPKIMKAPRIGRVSRKW